MSAKKIKPAQLRDAFKTDLAACWQYARSLHPKETPYAFALHGLEGTPHFYPYVLTEESLTQVAKRYVADGYYEKLPEARKELRYSMEDSPYGAELESRLPTVDALMESVEHLLDETDGYALLAKAAMDAFAALDKQGFFGKGKQREKLLLMIETEDAEKDWSLPSVKRLNPRVAVKRYEIETKVVGDYVGSHHIDISADGRTLCFDAYREADPRTGKVFDDFVVCDVAGLRLRRRWAIISREEGLHISIKGMPDGTVFLSESNEDETRTKLLRFAKGDKSRKSQIELSGELSSVLSSGDGSRIVVQMGDGSVYELNQKLQIVATFRVPKNLRLERPLKSGDFLGLANRKLVRVSPELKVKPLPYRDEAWRVSLDDQEQICAISIFGKDKLICDQKPKDQFGFKLVSFPKMKLLCHICVPAHQLTKAVLSSDGRLVVCESNECGKYTSTALVVFDTKNGREIARRKVDRVSDMKFLPGKHVVVMTTSGNMITEPILFWKIR